MMRGMRVAAGRARNPTLEANDGWPTQRVGGGLQAWPHGVVASPPTATNAAMAVRGDTRHPTRPMYRPPPIAGPIIGHQYAPAVTNAPDRRSAVVHGQGRPPISQRYSPAATNLSTRKPAAMHQQGAVWHGNRQMHPVMTAAAADDGFRASVGEAALAAQLLDVQAKAHTEHAHAMRLVEQMERKVFAYRRRAEAAERHLELVSHELEQEQMASDALNAIVRENKELLVAEQHELEQEQMASDSLTHLLAVEKGRTEGLMRAVEDLHKERADSEAWAHEPTDGGQALNYLHPGGGASGPPREAKMQRLCFPGILRDIVRARKANGCACRREFAANALSIPQLRFEDTVVLGKGGFGTVYRGRCKKRVRSTQSSKLHRMGPHKNLINIECISDVTGSEGLVMELAVCDMLDASTGRSSVKFSLSQQLSLEADATEGLNFMHSAGFIHCDVKLDNTLICRSGGPTGFVGKITDPGVWCGLGETRGKKTGTVGWIPVENMNGDIAAEPSQDAFAVGVDLCSILAKPEIKNEDISIWSCSQLMTVEEEERLRVLRAEGGNLHQLRAEVTLRTMSDGSLSRIFLQDHNFNSALPPSAARKVCEALKKTLSRDPLDRLLIPDLTALLRDLAWETAAEEEKLAAAPPGLGLQPDAALPPGVGLPPGLALAPGLDLPPPGMPSIGGGGDRGEGLIPLADDATGGSSTIAHASELPAPGLVGSGGGRDGNISGGLAEEGRVSHLPLDGHPDGLGTPSMEWVDLAPPLPAGSLAGGEDVGASAAAVPSAVAAEVPHGSEIYAEGGTDGAGAAATVPSSGSAEVPHGSELYTDWGTDGTGAAAAVSSAGSAEVPHGSELYAEGGTDGAGAADAVPSAGSAEVPHGSELYADWGTDGTGAAAAVPSAEAPEAPHGSSPIGSAPRTEEGSVDGAALPSMDDVDGWMARIGPTVPGSRSWVSANMLADWLRSLRPPYKMEYPRFLFASVVGPDTPLASGSSAPADDAATPSATALPVGLSGPS